MGSMPVGLVVAKVKGVDLRKVGSGNIGATNVLRALGKVPALITLSGDMFKGFIPVLLSTYILDDPLTHGIVGLFAILGHDFSLFLRFRGGKGVATSIGVILAYAPIVSIITILLWITVVFMTRYSSMGAIVSFILFPINIYIFDYTHEKFLISILITLLLLFKHRENIGRLLSGKEPKIGERVNGK